MTPSRLRISHLLAAWSAYWLGLGLVTLGPAAWAAWPLTRLGHHGSVSASVSNAVASLKVMDGTATVWSGSAHLATIVLWIGLPPLAVWALWLATRPRVDESGATRPAELPRDAAEPIATRDGKRSAAELRGRR